MYLRIGALLGLFLLIMPVSAGAVTLFGIDLNCDPAKNPSSGGCGIREALKFVSDAVKAISLYVIPLATAFMAYGAYQIMTAGSDSGKVSSGRKTMTYAAVGIAIVLSCYLVVTLFFKLIPLRDTGIKDQLRDYKIIRDR